MKTKIYPVILCGGSGTRLWPLSRKSYPKQFAQLVGTETLFQSCALRLSGQSDGFEFAAPTIVTNSDFRFIVTEQLHEIGIEPGAILIEPDGRNTAPAVLAAATYLADIDPNAVLLIAPSDHVVPDHAAFKSTISHAMQPIEQENLVTFGITPNRAETGYGYLEMADIPKSNAEPLVRFVEKPDADSAQAMVDSGKYLWNAGIFMFSARSIIAAFSSHCSNMIDPVARSITNAKTDLGFLRLDKSAWSEVENISIDYAVMEKADNLYAVPFGSGWSDLGGWDAVWRESDSDNRGVVTQGPAQAIDCDNTLLRSENSTLELVGIGLENIIAVAMNDAVLVADMTKAQDVKLAVDALQKKEAKQATAFPKDHRPWGWFESLVIGDRFQVKRIVVHPGAALSLQSHVHRAEHWIVVEGTAKVTIDDMVKLVGENQSVFIPLGAVHRMENPGKVPMVLIEVQTGSYLGEDDIVRYEDVYARE